MICNCNDHAVMADPNHKPCGPCAEAARAMAENMPGVAGAPHSAIVLAGGHSGRPPQFVGSAQSDLDTIQRFLNSVSTGTSPSPSEIQQAQDAANSLSVSIFPNPDASKPTLTVGQGVAIVAGGA